MSVTIQGTFAQQQNPLVPAGSFFVLTDGTPLSCDITNFRTLEYTESQFCGDISKSSIWLNQLIADAIKEDEEGKTIEFPG